MFLPLPVFFDENEWFILISDLLLLLIFFYLPRRFPWAIVVMVMLFNSALSKTADYTLANSIPFNLYDYNDTSRLDLFDEILHFTLYPLVAYFFVYWWDVWRERGFHVVWYILLGAAVSTLYEWFAVQAHVFTYKGWHLYYSSCAYVILLSINVYFLSRVKRWVGGLK